jgi:Holliday junction resolvase RusA-like endonuclease
VGLANRGRPPLTGELEVWCDFYVRRPKTTKLDSPRGDLDNFLKALWDGCNEVIWEDDKQIVVCHATKQFTEGEGHIVMEIHNV